MVVCAVLWTVQKVSHNETPAQAAIAEKASKASSKSVVDDETKAKLEDAAKKAEEIAKDLAQQSAEVAKAGLEGLKAGFEAAKKAYNESKNK